MIKKKVLKKMEKENIEDLDRISKHNQQVVGRAEWKLGYFKGRKDVFAEARKEELEWIDYVLRELDVAPCIKLVFEVRREKVRGKQK